MEIVIRDPNQAEFDDYLLTEKNDNSFGHFPFFWDQYDQQKRRQQSDDIELVPTPRAHDIYENDKLIGDTKDHILKKLEEKKLKIKI